MKLQKIYSGLSAKIPSGGRTFALFKPWRVESMHVFEHGESALWVMFKSDEMRVGDTPYQRNRRAG